MNIVQVRRNEWMNRIKRLPVVSISLVAVNIVVFLVNQFMHHGLFDFGELSIYDFFLQKEYFRIITALFLHADVQHLFGNMMILLFLGAMLEEELGHIPLAVLYFLSGIGGNIASLVNKLMAQNTVASIGASGAIFGLDGVLLAIALFYRQSAPTVTPRRVVFMIFLSLYSGYVSSNIDNAAHVGGLVTGFVFGSIYILLRKAAERRRPRRSYWD